MHFTSIYISLSCEINAKQAWYTKYPVSYLMQRILDYNYKENIFLVDNEFNCMLEIAYKITKHKVF